MSTKFTLQALAFVGVLAVSGLPALAADMTPATPAPGAAIHNDVKGDVSGAGKSATTNTKADAKILPTDKKDSKEVRKNLKDSKELKSNEQTAKVPAPATAIPATPAPAAKVNGSVGTPVQR